MIARFLAVGLTLSAVAGCVNLTEDQEQVIAHAESIGTAPFKREELLSAFGIKDRPSPRLDGSVRSSRMSFTETWEHPSGLTITAYDSDYAGDFKIVPGSIDSLINDPGRKPTDFIGDPWIGPPRKSFEGFVISQGDKVLFRSNENQGEHGVGGQPATTPQVGD